MDQKYTGPLNSTGVNCMGPLVYLLSAVEKKVKLELNNSTFCCLQYILFCKILALNIILKGVCVCVVAYT